MAFSPNDPPKVFLLWGKRKKDRRSVPAPLLKEKVGGGKDFSFSSHPSHSFVTLGRHSTVTCGSRHTCRKFGVYLFFSKTGAHQAATHETQAQAITPVRATSRHTTNLEKLWERVKKLSTDTDRNSLTAGYIRRGWAGNIHKPTQHLKR